MNSKLTTIEKRLLAIELRNAHVQEDKAWETSFFRRFLLIIFTYVTIGLYMSSIGVASPWVNAVIPAVGFWLSTLSLPYFRVIWQKWFYKSA